MIYRAPWRSAWQSCWRLSALPRGARLVLQRFIGGQAAWFTIRSPCPGWIWLCLLTETAILRRGLYWDWQMSCN